jgi:hypothetical protein
MYVIFHTFMHLSLVSSKIENHIQCGPSVCCLEWQLCNLNIITSYAISKFVEQSFCQIVGCSKCIFAAVTPNFLARFPNWHSHFAEFHACLDSTTISGASIQGVCRIFRALFQTVFCLSSQNFRWAKHCSTPSGNHFVGYVDEYD